MNTLPPEIAAYKIIADALELTCNCSHPVLERRDDGFMYCFLCREYVPTVGD